MSTQCASACQSGSVRHRAALNTRVPAGVVDAAYEKRSTAISSNIHPSGFAELMPTTVATATVDRLLHHAHVVLTEGKDSYPLAQATAGEGVTPLT